MTFAKTISHIAAVVLVTASVAHSQAAKTPSTAGDVTTTSEQAADDGSLCYGGSCTLAGVRFGNPIDPSTWWDGTEGADHSEHATMDINPFDPDFWMTLPDPEGHSLVHMAITNPETWAQFVSPSAWMEKMDPALIIKWFDPNTYAVLMDPQTPAYWMQPGAYMHGFKSDNYAQLVDVSSYTGLAGRLWDGITDTFTSEDG